MHLGLPQHGQQLYHQRQHPAHHLQPGRSARQRPPGPRLAAIAVALLLPLPHRLAALTTHYHYQQ